MVVPRVPKSQDIRKYCDRRVGGNNGVRPLSVSASVKRGADGRQTSSSYSSYKKGHGRDIDRKEKKKKKEEGEKRRKETEDECKNKREREREKGEQI